MALNASTRCTNCNEGMTVQYAVALKPGPHHMEPICPVCRDPDVIKRLIGEVSAKTKRNVIIMRITY
ncbi:MAG TPA: hypothetical protein VI796_05730 [Candidatus Thermoplasmatota archaeon]|nr:hypothetical protein [Candidatus Thermoplasmatota archaeon]